MGFYGNITNTNKTQFTFDRSYSSRALMDQRIDRDGIYLGRYVLVEYSLDTSKDMYYLAFKKSYNINGENVDKFYAAADFDPRTELKYTDNPYAITTKVTSENNSTVYVTTGQVIRTREYIDGTPDEILSDVFYKCTGGDENGIALFEKLVVSNDHYTANYGIDKALYKTENYNQGRGYDSTVWQKVYVGEDEKYVMIAELNTVTPTFELSVDAPTMKPITPHFGTDSTNLNYKLHWQPQWGLRVAAETDTNKSDEQVIHINYPYDKEKNTFTEERLTVPGAIYFNKAGFDKYNRVYHEPEDPKNNPVDNYLKIQPVQSGALYNSHDGSLEQVKKEDIYEMSVHLPAFGNAMSDLWDALIGWDRKADATEDINSVSWLKNNLKQQILEIKSLIGGDKPNSILMTNSDGTIVGGLLNGSRRKVVSDILEEKIWSNNIDNIDTDDAWIHTDITGPVDTGIVDDLGNPIILPGNINIYHNFKATVNSSSTVNRYENRFSSSGESYKEKHLAVYNRNMPKNQLLLYCPYVDAAGHVVGFNMETIIFPHINQLIETDDWLLHKEVGNSNLHAALLSHGHINKPNEDGEGGGVEDLGEVNTKVYGIANYDQATGHIISVAEVGLFWKGLTD